MCIRDRKKVRLGKAGGQSHHHKTYLGDGRESEYAFDLVLLKAVSDNYGTLSAHVSSTAVLSQLNAPTLSVAPSRSYNVPKICLLYTSRQGGKSKIFMSVVIPVVKAAFVLLSAIGKNLANAGVARLCGVSPHPCLLYTSRCV